MTLMFFQFGLEALKQREGIGRGASKTGQNPAVVEPAHLARGAFDDDIPQGDLSVAADRHLRPLWRLAPHADDGGAVKLFHAALRLTPA